MSSKNIVVIGGGNGTAVTINALKNYQDFKLSAVISMADSGGSSGRLRNDLDTLPPGDIMRAILAMSPYDYEILKKIFYKNRFGFIGKLDEHNLGNLFLTLCSKYEGSILSAIRSFEQAIEAKGECYPNTIENTHLQAELENGKIILGESEIDEPKYDRNIKIKKAELYPEVQIYPAIKEIIENADVIILGPGSLYTSIVACLLPQGMFDAINNSKAKLVYIPGNRYSLNGETGPTSLSGFVQDLEKYLPRKIDNIIFNKKNQAHDQIFKENNCKEIEFDIEDKRIIFSDYEDEQCLPDYKIMGDCLKQIIG